MLLARYTQQPAESKLRDIQCSRWLRDGETLVSVTAAVTQLSGTTATLTCTPTIVGDDQIKYLVAGGIHLAEYKIDFTIVTTLQTRQDEVIFRIVEV